MGELCRNSRCSKSSRATRLMEDARAETCQQPSTMCRTLLVESTVTQIIPRRVTSGEGLGTVSGGNQVASVTSWKYAVPPCTGGACDNQDEAALAAVVAKSGPVSICVNAATWDPYTSGVFTGDCNPAYNDMDHCVQLVGFDTAASLLTGRSEILGVRIGVRLGSSGCPM